MEKVLMIEAHVIADSISEAGKRITTLQVKFHRFILPEFNTHRVFSRNFSSSRAIPTAKLIEQVRTDPAIPVHWGKNQPGMQAAEELEGIGKQLARDAWMVSADVAAGQAGVLSSLNVHKQIVNRVLEPYMWVTGIVTATEWDNWFELRAHEDAQPEIHELALRMKEAMDKSRPMLLDENCWHLPYVSLEEMANAAETNKVFPHDAYATLAPISAARCCRVSYLKQDGSKPNIEDDLKLFDRLVGSAPLHASPLEHQAYSDIMEDHPEAWGNFRGWVQYRKVYEEKVATEAWLNKYKNKTE